MHPDAERTAPPTGNRRKVCRSTRGNSRSPAFRSVIVASCAVRHLPVRLEQASDRPCTDQLRRAAIWPGRTCAMNRSTGRASRSAIERHLAVHLRQRPARVSHLSRQRLGKHSTAAVRRGPSGEASIRHKSSCTSRPASSSGSCAASQDSSQVADHGAACSNHGQARRTWSAMAQAGLCSRWRSAGVPPR